MAEQQRLSPSGLQSMLTALVRTAQDGKDLTPFTPLLTAPVCCWLLEAAGRAHASSIDTAGSAAGGGQTWLQQQTRRLQAQALLPALQVPETRKGGCILRQWSPHCTMQPLQHQDLRCQRLRGRQSGICWLLKALKSPFFMLCLGFVSWGECNHSGAHAWRLAPQQQQPSKSSCIIVP